MITDTFFSRFFPDFSDAFTQAIMDEIDTEMMATLERASWLYLLPPPALRPGCLAGNICTEETFYTPSGFPTSIFVPEAGCPVHDSEVES